VRTFQAGVLLLAALVGLYGCSVESGEGRGGAEAVDSNDENTLWTCSMHPQVMQDSPGDCPLCGMDLIPVEREPDRESAEARTISFTEAGARLMEIETSVVTRRPVDIEIELVGRVTYDAGRVAVVSARVPGRIEKLYVDSVGDRVAERQPLFELYGAELLAAQRELSEAASVYGTAREAGDEGATNAALELLQAVRDRLSLWGVSADQISAIEKAGPAGSTVAIVSPITGTVVEERVVEGSYVTTGQQLFTIADLSSVWVDLSAHETDLALLAEGQPVSFRAAALPGRRFDGVLTLVEPIVDPATRTVTARAEVDNPDGVLRPEMFVTAEVSASATLDGAQAPIVIPSSAPLLTGKRAVVYVEVDDAAGPTFEGREIVLGPRAGDHYIVVSGLVPGERVVTNGAFKIDSALQIRAKPSMMSPSGAE
jgi:Cu(I)/Ag(I) efflux system membrane fusion protein